MVLLILASLIAYVTTEIDDLLVLLVLFSKASTKREKASIILGKYLGISILCGCCGYFVSYISKLNTAWVGLLGVVPILMGIKSAVDAIKHRSEPDKFSSKFGIGSFFITALEVMVITLASSGDNIAVYISFFTSVHGMEYIIVAIVFFIMQAIWCTIAILIVNEKSIKQYISQSSRLLIPMLFIALGIYIMVKDGTILWLLGK